MSDPKPRPSLRVDTLASALDETLENEAAILDLLVSALARGQANEPLWDKLHEAALRDDRLAELAFAYERLVRDKKLKSLTAPAQATVLAHAGVFFARVFGDADGAETYLERALALAPGDMSAFEVYEQILTGRGDLRRLGELFAAAAPHRGERADQLALLRRGADLVEGDPERALKLHLEILRLDPADPRSKQALSQLYEKTGRLADLAKLLEQIAADGPPADEARAIRARLLGLYAGGLGEIERALPHVEELLRLDPTHEQARRVGEDLIAHKALTARAAAALGAAYEAAGEPSEAARLYAVEIEAVRGPKRLEAQKKLAVLTLEQLGDLEKTFSMYESLVPLDPVDDDVRARFVQLASALDKQLEATRTLNRGAASARDPAVRARIGADLGDLFRELGDAKKARASYQGVLDARAADDASLRSARALAALSAEPRDPRALAVALGTLSQIEPEEGARLKALVELAKVSEDEIADPPAAIAAHERLLGTRLEAEARTALARLYEKTGAFAALADLLDHMVAAEKDTGRAQKLAFKAAELRTSKLPDRGAALLAWQGYVALFGASREALSHLVPLLEHEKRWDELATALAKEASLAPAEEQAALYARLGLLRLSRLNDARGALEAHRQALSLDPNERQSRVAVDRLLAAGDLRLAAADVLEPIARAEGSTSTLVRVLEARAALLDDPARRLLALEEAAELCHQGLRDPKRAVELAARGLGEALAASLDAVPAWVDRVDRLSAGGDAARRSAALRDALGDRAVDHPALALLARRAGEALVQSGDVTSALAVYRRALAFEPSSPELLSRVDALLREQGSPEERLSLYRAALDQAADPARRRELLHAMGAIERRDLGDAAAALRTYRIALGESPDDDVALSAVLEILEATGAWKDLYAELEAAFARAAGPSRVALRLRLAEVAAARGWLDEAAVHYGEIIAADGGVSDEILTAAEHVARSRDKLGLLRAVIERRIAAAVDPQDEATWRARLGELLQDRFGDAAGAAEAFGRAAKAAEEAGDPARAAGLLERVLEVAPGDRAAAERLLTLYAAAEAWARLPPIYGLLLRATTDAGEAARILLAFEAPAVHAGAEDRFLAEATALLAREGEGDEALAAVRSARARVLGRDPARFAETAAAYRAVLEAGDDASGAEARAFDAILATRGPEAAPERRWLFAHRADRAADGDRVRILMAWAAAEEGELGDPAAAAELYGRVVAQDPENDAALAARARLLLAQGDHAGAAAAIDRRRSFSEGAARAALDVELAALLLDPMDQPVEALAVLAPVIESGPPDPAALRLVERALARPASRRAAADLLERAADAAFDVEAFASLMNVLLVTPADDPVLRPSRRGWFERLLDRPGLPPPRALDAALSAATELPGDLAFWERAEQLARGLHSPERVAHAYRRALGVVAVRTPGSARPIPEPASPEVAPSPSVAGLDAETIEEVGRRAVDYHEEWFDEPETVIALIRRLLSLCPASLWSFERLKLIYNLAERWDDLFALYDDAIARAEDADARRDLLEDAALAAKDLASDSGRAMRYYEALYALRPDPRVRTALERLFERHGRHRALIDLLSAELPSASPQKPPELETAQKLRARVAQLWLEGVGEADPAVTLAEEMLAAEPGRPEAIDLLERVMARDAATPEARSARRRAAGPLRARYQSEGRAEDLLRVLEIDLEAAATPEERAGHLRAIVELRLTRLHDEAGAFEGTAALLALEPDRAEHRAELGRLSERLGRPARLAEALAAAAGTAEGAARIDLLAQAARVYEDRLADATRAIELYRTILGLAGDDTAALAAARSLDRLLAGAGRAAERCDVLERLAALEPEAAARRAARQELSRLSLAEGDQGRAVRAFRAALAEDPGDAVAEEGLSRALEDAGRWEELCSVLEARAARGGDDARVRADRVRVARLYEHPIGDTARAVEAWQEVQRTFGADDESTDALAQLLTQGGRFFELVALLEGEATRAADDGRAADLWVRIGDLHRARTGNLDEAVAAYDLALELRPSDPAARRGLEALLGALDLAAETTRRTLGAAVGSLSRLYGAADDHAAAVALLEPRLAAAASDAERVAVLTETAALYERRAGDPGGAFDAIFRAFTLSPSEALAVRLTRLADLAERWSAIAGALPGWSEVPPLVLRELFHRVALWQRDRGDEEAAEAALVRALGLGPESEPLLAALADVQRRSPTRALVDTLLRLSAARDGDLEVRREAVVVAEALASQGGDRAFARDLAEHLLDAAAADFSREDARPAAAWAIEALARMAETPATRSEIFLRGARLPFAPTEQRRLRLAAAELAGGDAAMAVYEELFAEVPSDATVAARLDTIYRSLGRRDAQVALRERQIAAGPDPSRLLSLRVELASLRAEGGDREGAIAALRDNLSAGLHAPSVEKLAELYEAGGHDADLVKLCEDRAAAAEREGALDEAMALWARAGAFAEEKLADEARAVAFHRRAAALGSASSDEVLARLLTARGDHAGAAEVLERICDRAPPDALAEAVLRLVDALKAAGRPSAARTRLERAAGGERPGAPLRQRLVSLYRETGEWKALAFLHAEDAARTVDPAARGALLREAAEIHLGRRGDPAAAIPLLEQVVELTPDDAAAHLRLASARRATGDLDQAAATLRAMLLAYGGRRPKERAVVHYELAQVSLAKGDRPRAVGELDAALRIDPAHPEILHALARLSFEEGQLDRAARTYRTLLMVVRRPRADEGPALNEVSRAEVLFELAEIARLRGEPDKAAEQLDSAFEAARESAGERDRLLASLRARGRHEPLARALEARLAEGLPPAEAAAVQAELATLYEDHLGRTGEALDARLSALSLAPPSTEALDRALELSRKAGQVERWVAAVTRLAEAEPDEDRAVALHASLGRALEHDLHDDARAASAYLAAEALAVRSATSAPLVLASLWRALAGVYGRLGDVGAQEALLERRIEAVGPETEPPELADTLYQLAELRLRRPDGTAGAIDLLDRAFETDPQPARSEALLRDALARGADATAVGRALEHLARVTGADRLLIDALVILSEIPTSDAHAADPLEPLREAVAIAARLDDVALSEQLLRKAVARSATAGDALLDWAFDALAALRTAAGDLGEAADLRERAARASDPERERSLLLEVAALAAGPLGDRPRAARLYEELRAREPAEREIWQPLAEVYRLLGDRTRLSALLEETAPLLEGAAERARLRLERARMAIDEDQEKAVALLKEVIEDDPTQVEAAAVLSELLEKLGRREDLADLVRHQLDAAKDREDRPRVVQLSLRLGGLLEQAWDEQGALDAYHAALDWEPKSRDLLRQIVHLATTRDDSMALGDALAALLDVEEGDQAVELSLRLAQIRGDDGDGAAATAALERGWQARPGDPRLREELVRRYTEAGAWKQLAAIHVADADARTTPEGRVECLRLAADLLSARAGDTAGAAEVLARALEEDPTQREVLVALIEALTATGQHARAVDAVGRALSAQPGDAWLHRTRAALHETMGRDQAALLDLEQAYEKSGGGYAEELITALTRAAAACAGKTTPEGRAALRGLRLRLAAVLAQAGDLDRARVELTDLTHADGRDRTALHALALLEESVGDWDAASAIYARLVALEEGEGLIDTALRLADACERGDRLGDARAALERARQVAPDNAAVRDRLRQVYNVTGAGRELGALLLDDASRTTDPAVRFTSLIHAGRLFLDAEGEMHNAIAVFEQAKALRPDDAEAMLLLADSYTIAGRLAEARAVLDGAVAAQRGRRTKALSAVHRRLARLDLAAGENDAALAALTRAFDNDPQNAQLAMELGSLAVQLEEHEPATRAFRAVTLMKSVPAGSPEGATASLRALSYYHLGRMAFIQGDKRKARLMIDKAVADDPTLEEARHLLDQLRNT
jgi:tetratricopeptide (TPR) repeat protein